MIDQELSEGFQKEWIENYLEKLKERIAEGDLPKNIEKLEKYLDCYRGLDSLEEPMMKRIFSKRYLKDSKIFEREMERNVVTAAREILPGDYGRYGYPDGSGAVADRRKFPGTGS